MELLFEPQAWASFLTLALLEIVLGIDNILFLSILVDRLPMGQRTRARIVGLSFAMVTRLALLFSVIWLTTLRKPLLTFFGCEVSGRDLILFAGGAFLIVQSAMEIRELTLARGAKRKTGSTNGFWLIILQIGIIDIAFSLDTVFTAIGIANRIEVMVAAIIVSVPVMMGLSSGISRLTERYPSLKTLALVLLVLVGISLIADSAHREIPQRYLYFAMAFTALVAAINIRLRRRG